MIRSDHYAWHRYDDGELVPTSTPATRYELWDGGVYDNLGVEPLFKPSGGFRDGFDMLVVSDASAPLEFAPRTLRRMKKPGHRVLRLIDIAADQIQGLRSRTIVARFVHTANTGVYFRMGNTVDQIYSAIDRSAPPGAHLSAADAKKVATFPTTLRCLTQSEFTLLRQNGFEVANATLATRLPRQFTLRENFS